MKSQTELKGFFKLFFAKINTYRDVKQGYDDLCRFGFSLVLSIAREGWGNFAGEIHEREGVQ